MCVSGLFVSMELKIDGDTKPDPLQDYNIVKIRKAGGIAWHVYPENWPEIFVKIKALARVRREGHWFLK